LVIFERELSPNDVRKLNFDPNIKETALWWFTKKWFIKHPKKWSWFIKNPVKTWLVSLEEIDFKSKLHVYHPEQGKSLTSNTRNFMTPDGETSLSLCSEHLFKTGNYQFKRNFDDKKAREHFWIIVGRRKEGPFVLLDGNHRAIRLYIENFIEKKNSFQPCTKVLCGICDVVGIRIFDLVDNLKK